MTPRTVLVIVNPAAGGGRGRTVWRRVEPTLQGGPGSLTLRMTEGPGAAERLARESAPGFDCVCLVGGDGTIHEAVNGLLARETSPALVVIPAGTGNDFAAGCGVPLDPMEAALALSRGESQPVDVGTVAFRGPDGAGVRRHFLNSLSIGVSPHANALAHRLRRFLPGRWCYRLGGLVALLTRSARPLAASGDGRPLFEGPLLNLTIANVPSFGGGMRISPGSTPFDGRLDLVAVGPLGIVRALSAFARLRRGTHLTLPGVTLTPGLRVVRLSGTGLLEVEADGQNFVADQELAIELHERPLLLIR